MSEQKGSLMLMEKYQDRTTFLSPKLKRLSRCQKMNFSKNMDSKNQVKATKMSFSHVKLEGGQTLQENCFKNKVTITSEFMKEVSLIGATIMVLFAFQMTKIVRL